MVDVLVVGAGPVGLTMAAEAARYGLSVRIIDKSPHATTTSKALVIWSRTLELFDRMGCSGEFLAGGIRSHGATAAACSAPQGSTASRAPTISGS
jgi:2-polyprenyl-6-methoxyphenol hydroxylase-like FAD-dependent oxidoreductase